MLHRRRHVRDSRPASALFCFARFGFDVNSLALFTQAEGSIRRIFLKLLSIFALLLLTPLSCLPQEAENFKPSDTNVWGAEYPRVDTSGKVQIRIKAPNATTVKL